MQAKDLVLGIDLGTTGVRLAIIDEKYQVIYFSSNEYVEGLNNCEDWKKSCQSLIKKIPDEIKERLVACSIDGTSGTLVGCNSKGKPLGKALPYFAQYMDSQVKFDKAFHPKKDINSSNNSFGRALKLVEKFGENILLRHQADWISGWFLNNWEFGEEGNNIRLGWDLIKQSWPEHLKNVSWSNALPKIIPSGNLMGTIALVRAKELSLPIELKIIAGTTDSNAAVLATGASFSEGITVLGSTIVIKRFSKYPLKGEGITNHLVGGQWLVGGASNTGCAVLKKFFSEEDLIELSRQIDPELDSGLNFRPLVFQGERFPVNDPFLLPILKPRPISDSLYLHGLLEGLSRIEAKGWRKLIEEGLEKPTKIITLGGGARNPQWRRIRERLIGIPICTCSRQPAEGVARIALNAFKKNFEDNTLIN